MSKIFNFYSVKIFCKYLLLLLTDNSISLIQPQFHMLAIEWYTKTNPLQLQANGDVQHENVSFVCSSSQNVTLGKYFYMKLDLFSLIFQWEIVLSTFWVLAHIFCEMIKKDTRIGPWGIPEISQKFQKSFKMGNILTKKIRFYKA